MPDCSRIVLLVCTWSWMLRCHGEIPGCFRGDPLRQHQALLDYMSKWGCPPLNLLKQPLHFPSVFVQELNIQEVGLLILCCIRNPSHTSCMLRSSAVTSFQSGAYLYFAEYTGQGICIVIMVIIDIKLQKTIDK